MDLFLQVVVVVLYVFLITLIARVVIDLVQIFARDYRPAGFSLILFEVIYTVTDPPLRALRRVIPPLQLGSIRLDLAILVLFIGVQILIFIAQSVRLG
jgi:YggT family protein